MRKLTARGVGLVLSTCLLGTAGAICGENPSSDTPFRQAFTKEFNAPSQRPWIISRDAGHLSRKQELSAGEFWDMRPYSAISVQALRQKGGAGVVRLRWAVHSKVGGLYLAAQSHVVPTADPGGVAVDVSADSGELIPSGHQRPWDALSAASVVAIELRAEATFPVTSSDASFVIQLSKPAVETDKTRAAAKAAVLDLSLEPAPPGLRAAAMLTFRLSPMPADPYSAEGAGDVRVLLPGGAQALAFLDQEMISFADGAGTQQTLSGQPFFCAYLPELPKSGKLQIVSGHERWDVPVAALQKLSSVPDFQSPSGAQAAKDFPELRWQPPLQVSPPVNPDPATRMLPMSLLDATGVWQLASTPAAAEKLWRPVPFWHPNWGGFSGAHAVNITLAQQMDALLTDAAAAGRSQPLVILDGEMFDRQGTFNWLSHPLGTDLKGPGELYRTDAGKTFLRRWMRYCVARWGAYKSVSSFWMTPILGTPGASEFHLQAGAQLVQWNHPHNLPVYSSHPYARAPQIVKVSSDYTQRGRGGWRIDLRLGQAYGNVVEDGGLKCFEIRARDGSGTALGFVNPLYFPVVDWDAPAPDNFSAADTVLFDVWVPPDSPGDLRLGVHLRDRDGLWFDALVDGMANPGDWRTFALDITAKNANGLKPVDHAKAWNDYSRQRLTEIGLHVYSTHKDWKAANKSLLPLTARFSNIRAVKMYADATPKPEITLAPAAQQTQPGLFVGDVWQCSVAINKTFDNPFDAAECDVTAVIKTPSGKEVRIPAFFDQPCVRREEEPGGNEIVEPTGAEVFTVRYRILEAGAHTVRFELREGGKYETVSETWVPDRRFSPDGKAQAAAGGRGWGFRTNYGNDFNNGKRLVSKIKFAPGQVTATMPHPGFTVAAGSNPARKHPFRGFLRVADDKRHFQFDDGTFFYPLGPCLRSPSDNRIPYTDRKWNSTDIDKWSKRGTYQYDEYFAEFEKAGMNWGRVWMSPWWCALEWRRDWPGYQGVGRYNLLNAWRMDHLLAEAEARGIVIDLCLTNHGQYALRVDAEWINNPYNANLGGPLVAASEFFTRADAKTAHQNKLRYIIARYGHSTAVMAWALFSELEWTEEYEISFQFNRDDLPAPNMEAWHSEMGQFLNEIDLNRHMITTHFSHPSRGTGTLAVPEISYATSNAYSAFEEWGNGQWDASAAVAGFWGGVPYTVVQGFKTFNKPGLIEEHGRHWGGGRNNSKTQLEADLHAGLWGAVVQPLGGATGYWWWLHVHYDNQYFQYLAVSKFMAGEDMRPAKDEAPLEPVYRSKIDTNGLLSGRALKSDRRLYAWIYHRGTPYGDDVEDVSGAELSVGNMKPGKYSIEFWDTYSGEIIKSIDAEVTLVDGKPSSIMVQLPTVKRDLAMKIKLK